MRLADKPAKHVGRAAGRKRDDHGDGSSRIGLGRGGAGRDGEHGRNRGGKHSQHHFLPDIWPAPLAMAMVRSSRALPHAASQRMSAARGDCDDTDQSCDSRARHHRAGIGTPARRRLPGLTLACAAARDRAKAQAWLDEAGITCPLVEFDAFPRYADLAVECAPAAVLEAAVTPMLKAGKRVMVLSAGALLPRPRSRRTRARDRRPDHRADRRVDRP